MSSPPTSAPRPASSTTTCPTQLNDDELANVVNTAIAQVAEEIGQRPGMKQMGQVMKAAIAIAEGKADGPRISAAVKDRL